MEALDSLVHCASLPSAAQHDDIDGGSDHVDDGYDDLFRVGSILITILYLVHLIQRWQKNLKEHFLQMWLFPALELTCCHHHHYHYLPTFIFAKISPVPQGQQEDLAHYKRAAFLSSRSRAVPSDGAGLSCGFVDSPAKYWFLKSVIFIIHQYDQQVYESSPKNVTVISVFQLQGSVVEKVQRALLGRPPHIISYWQELRGLIIVGKSCKSCTEWLLVSQSSAEMIDNGLSHLWL